MWPVSYTHLQDLLGFVHLIPDRARERLLDIAATQFEDGSAYNQYQPLTKKGNMDIGSGFNEMCIRDSALPAPCGKWSFPFSTGSFFAPNPHNLSFRQIVKMCIRDRLYHP